MIPFNYSVKTKLFIVMLQREAIFSDPYNRMMFITFVEEYILIQHVGDETDALW